ncbi:2-oxoacid:acceptor oxidoreductase subunit alpha [Propionicicella superfundia]|uniref:2-oxoacid:acceptor oxidoreductase subunit alpha n=1 Tax=Propionicicella superfundia TaxID=348582 RepID=UPI000421B0EE|nr:2-oxoacid:acceptor oxidoreductase subunit alpha [Propionicicella superfundia]
MSSEHVLDRVVIRFAGDSGDGMQLTGNRFTADAARYGNDFSTLPNFPAEIRAPAGTLSGVSSFQLHFASFDIRTPGDAPDVLVAMNPAALKANIGDLPKGGIVIADTADFTPRNLKKVGYESDPLTDGSLDSYQVHTANLTAMTAEAVKGMGVGRADATRAKNMFALGMLTWLYNRPIEPTLAFLDRKFGGSTAVRDANKAALRSGYAFGETSELFAVRYTVAPAAQLPGTYRQIHGNQALAYGLMAGAELAGLPLFLGAYPITPASDVLHELSRHKALGVTTFQAEDEIAAAGAALGASFGGALGVTVSSGPGIELKLETIGLGVMLELPLVVVNVQRAGPSTGMPTKTEQADLLQALYGRNGEAPVPVLAPESPGDCFDIAVEACRIALRYRTPVMILSDGYLANGSEPWRVPDLADLPRIDPGFATEPNGPDGTFLPYKRDDVGARAWALPGTPGLEHRVGGLEKADLTGNISYDPANHERMVILREEKIAGIVRDIPDLQVDDPVDDPRADEEATGRADVLVVGWGSTSGPIAAAVRRVRLTGRRVARLHLRHLNPLPANLGTILSQYRRIIVPEMNRGQLTTILRARYLVPAEPYSRVRGLPISLTELAADLIRIIDEEAK